MVKVPYFETLVGQIIVRWKLFSNGRTNVGALPPPLKAHMTRNFRQSFDCPAGKCIKTEMKTLLFVSIFFRSKDMIVKNFGNLRKSCEKQNCSFNKNYDVTSRIYINSLFKIMMSLVGYTSICYLR